MLENNNITMHQVSCLLGTYDSQSEQQADTLSLSYLFDVCPMQSWSMLLHSDACQVAKQVGQKTRWFNTLSYYQILDLHKSSQEWYSEFNIETHPLWLKNIQYIQKAKQVHPKTPIKYSLPGPLTYLWFNDYLGQSKGLTAEKLTLLPKLIGQYKQIFQGLEKQDIDWIQLDDPVFVTDILSEFQDNIISCYQDLLTEAPCYTMLATYFGGIEENINWLKNMPFQGLHLDLEAAPEQIMFVLKNDLMKKLKVLSLGGIRESDSYFGAIQNYMTSYIKFKPDIWIGFSSCLSAKKSSSISVPHEKMIDVVKVYIESNLDCPNNYPKILALKNYVTSLKNTYPDITISLNSLGDLISFMKKRDRLNFIQHVESLKKIS